MISLQKRPFEIRNGFKHNPTLDVVREMPCVCCKSRHPYYPTEAHHRIGEGGGLKASDLLTFPLCSFHHALYGSNKAIHLIPLNRWEKEFNTQNYFILKTHEQLGITIYKEYLDSLKEND